MMKRRDYKELAKDDDYIKVVENLDESLDRIEESFRLVAPLLKSGDLTISEQIKLDNYLIYSVNSLYWIYLKLQGEDPNQNPIKNELNRVRETISRDRQLDTMHQNKRLVLDKAPAKRFIKRALRIPRDQPPPSAMDSSNT